LFLLFFRLGSAYQHEQLLLRYNLFVIADRDNAQWLQDLRSEGIRKEAALSDLRALIIKNLPYGLSSYLSSSDPRYEALAARAITVTSA
jgi:hypothetical protein